MATYDELVLLLLLLLLPLVSMLLALGKGKKQKGPLKPKLAPGPRGLPLIGNLHQLGTLPHRTLGELSKRHGPVMHLQLCGVPALIISSAEMAEVVLRTHDLNFCSRPGLIPSKRLSYNFSDVGLSPYGATWRKLRKIFVVSLVNTRKVEEFRPVREEEVERMMASISSLASLSKPINLTKLLHSLFAGIICRVAFGKKFLGREKERTIHQILCDIQTLMVGFFAADYFPWAWWVDVLTGQRARLERHFHVLDAFLQEIIEAHTVPTRPRDDEEDFVDVLLRLQKEDPSLTQDHVKGLLMDVLTAGVDTSFAALEYAMAELVRNPNAMLRAQEEVRRTVGDKGKVDESDIPQLNYLKSVVKETLRLHPVAPLLLPRETASHIKINGYDVLPKTRVLVNAWAIGRERASWERPDEFIPERFMDSSVDFKGHDFQFIPFGAGRRICPGMSLGVQSLELALANLLYAFNWEAPMEGVDMDESVGLIVHLKNDLRLKAVK